MAYTDKMQKHINMLLIMSLIDKLQTLLDITQLLPNKRVSLLIMATMAEILPEAPVPATLSAQFKELGLSLGNVVVPDDEYFASKKGQPESVIVSEVSTLRH